jgi:Tfp pilus assembly protein PilX
MKKSQQADGFILMIVVLVLLVVAVAGLAFFRVQSANN